MSSRKVYTHINEKKKSYYLHGKMVTLRGDQKRMIYYFAKEVGEGSLSELPEGMEVIENERTGLPMLKKQQKA